METIRDCFLHQHISETTRRRGQDEPSLIDLLFTDEPMQVSNIIHHAPLGKSDHSVISFRFNCYLDYTKPKDRYAYEKADFQGMRDYLEENKWKDDYLNLATNRNKDEQWNCIKTTIHEMRDEFVPKMENKRQYPDRRKTSRGYTGENPQPSPLDASQMPWRY